MSSLAGVGRNGWLWPCQTNYWCCFYYYGRWGESWSYGRSDSGCNCLPCMLVRSAAVEFQNERDIDSRLYMKYAYISTWRMRNEDNKKYAIKSDTSYHNSNWIIQGVLLVEKVCLCSEADTRIRHIDTRNRPKMAIFVCRILVSTIDTVPNFCLCRRLCPAKSMF